MIHVKRKKEPAEFDDRVREPGKQFLARIPAPKGKQWNGYEYWRRILHHLHTEYGGICAYSCHWIPYDTGAQTVEHFKPKDVYPAEAYEWSNYRLVCGTLNGRKGKYEDVFDPFNVQNGWFIIDFPSLLVKPSDELGVDQSTKVQTTIDRLMLNDEGTCLKSRQDWIMSFCYEKFTFAHLEEKAPFLALELKRQGLVLSIRSIMLPGLHQ